MNSQVEKNCGGMEINSTAYQICVEETLKAEQINNTWSWIGSAVIFIAFMIGIAFIIKHD